MTSFRKYALPAVVLCFGLAAGLALDGDAVKSLAAENVGSGAVLAGRSRVSSDLPKKAVPSVEQTARQLSVRPTFIRPAQFAWAFGGAFFLICLLIRHRKRSASGNVKRKDASSAGPTMGRLAVQMSVEAPVDVPRNLLEKPFSTEIKGIDFETRVQCAITGSLRHGRVLGVIHLGFRISEVDGTASNAKLLNIRMGAMQKELEANLRSGDCVKITGEGKISVIIPLLASLADLETIAARLYVVAFRAGPELDLPVAYQPGCAMYPIDGYSAAELIEAARYRACHAAPLVDGKLGASAHQEPANAGDETHHGSLLKGEDVLERRVNPRLAVLQYPQAFAQGLNRRLVGVNQQNAVAHSLTQSLLQQPSSTGSSPP